MIASFIESLSCDIKPLQSLIIIIKANVYRSGIGSRSGKGSRPAVLVPDLALVPRPGISSRFGTSSRPAVLVPDPALVPNLLLVPYTVQVPDPVLVPDLIWY